MKFLMMVQGGRKHRSREGKEEEWTAGGRDRESGELTGG